MSEQVSSTSNTRRVTRRWRVPATYLHGAERFDGACLLEESSGPLGLLLWQCERDVRLWALSAPGQREFVFSAGASARCLAMLESLGTDARALHAPVGVIAGMLAHPMDVAGDVIMLACGRISRWAESRGAVATALTFAQAAALAQPASAQSAYQVGRLARRAGQTGRAEGWLNRAIVLARQARDWDSYAAAYSGLGNVKLMRGNLPSAERCQLKALRIARRHENPARAGAALHDLFVVAAEREDSDRALEYAQRAFQTYPAGHSGHIALAHDVASMWMDLGEFQCAFPILRVVWSHLDRDRHVIGLANVARAAGALNDRATFEEYSRLAQREMEAAPGDEPYPGPLLNIARGASNLGDLAEARTLAQRALASADQRGEHKLRFEAEALLQSLRLEQVASVQQPTASSSAAREFAREVASSIGARPPVPQPA